MIKTLLWTSNQETLEKYNLKKIDHRSSFFVSQNSSTKFSELRKKMKEFECDKVLKIDENNTFELIYKFKSIWTTISFEKMVYYWMHKNDIKPMDIGFSTPDKLKKNSKTSPIPYPFKFEEKNKDEFLKIVNFYLEADSIMEIHNFLSENPIQFINTEFNENTNGDFDNFIKRIEIEKQPGIEIKSIIKKSDAIFQLNTKYGPINITKEDETIKIVSCLTSEPKENSNLYFFTKGIVSNIKFNINQEIVQEKRKIKTKDIFIWAVSFSLIVILIFVTFNILFSPKNSEEAFRILFSGYTWSHGWIYLLLMNFALSILYGPLIGAIIFKLSNPQKKISWSNFFNFFLAGQIRLTTTFLTGNAILATVIWGWYMVNITKVKTTALIGTIASMNIIRGCLLLPIGFVFMVRGTAYNWVIMNHNSQFFAYTTLTWIGWLWNILHNLSVSLLIILPPLHILYNKFVILKYGRKGNVDGLVERITKFEMDLISLKSSFKNLFKNKQRTYRILIFILLNIFLETFEYTYALHITEGYASNVRGLNIDVAPYMNLFAISGVRYAAGFIHHVPLINVIPGQGIGFTDIALKTSSIGIINQAHINEGLSETVINDIGEQTTIIIRLFNFYFKRLIAIIITIFIVLKITLRNR